MTEIEHEAGGIAPVPAVSVDDPASPYDANKPPQQIEADIARTRDRVGSTLDALEQKLSPRRLIAESTDGLLDAVGGDPDRVWAQLRANAIPLGLIAAGLAWLAFARQEPRSGTHGYVGAGRAKTAGMPLPLAAIDTPPRPVVEAPEPIDPVLATGAGLYGDAPADTPGERASVDLAAAADKPAIVTQDETPLLPDLIREQNRKGE